MDMLFEEVAKAYSQIEAESGRINMTKILADLFSKTPPDLLDKVVYLTLGKLYPDYVGVELGMADRLAIKAISIASGLSEGEIERMYKEMGDLGSVAEAALKRKTQMAFFVEDLTVQKVYGNLERIAKATGAGSQDRKIRLLAELLNIAKPLEARYIVRMVTGRLRLGVADMTVLDALAVAFAMTKAVREKIERAYNLHPDLGYIAKVLAKEGLEGVEKIGITLGIPVRPMLAERLKNIDEIFEKIGPRVAFEYKYDGMRAQIHIGEKVKMIYSRRLENVTHQFPDVLKAVEEAFQGREAIFDGEMVPVDVNTGELLPFQVVSHRRGRKYDIEKMVEEIPVILFLFDIIYLDGEDLTMKPYEERREILERVVKETEKVRYAHRIVTEDKLEAQNFMDQAILDGCEGVVAKKLGPDAIYRAGVRGFLWIKYKRDYQMELGDTLDLVVVGAFAGKGKRKGTYGALLMAAYNPERDMFETVCKLGTGFSDEELAELPKKLEPYRIDHKHPRVDSQIEADFWFVPSVVLEVVGAEITLSPVHTAARDKLRKGAGLAVRFPRFTGRWRTDKKPEDATTIQELIEMYKNQVKKVVE